MDMLIWGIVCIVMAIAEVVTLQLVSVWFPWAHWLPFWRRYSAQAEPYSSSSLWWYPPCCWHAPARSSKSDVQKIVPTNADREIGSTATIIETVDGARGTGRARKDGVDWIAVAANGQIIPEGTVVRITDIRGAKLFVEPAEAPKPAASAAKQ